MNSYQNLWWEQTRSDHAILLKLRQYGGDPCHHLHYLQMVTEKLGKAYFWRSGTPPPKSHASFVRFLQAVTNRPTPDRTRIAQLLGFSHASGFKEWIRTITLLAYELEHLPLALAGDQSPNPEYPWPRLAPVYAPATYDFEVWARLTGSGSGRQLLKVIDAAVREFPKYG